MFLGLSSLELLMLTGLALALFGPDKLPGAVRDGARILHQIRSMAEHARADVLEGIGPEFAALDPRGLNVRTLVRERLADVLDPMASAGEQARREARGIRDAARLDERADRAATAERPGTGVLAAQAAAQPVPARRAEPDSALSP